MAGSKSELHGYDAVFEPELEQRNKCPVCLAGLREPVQTKCGHRFCRNCLTQSRGKARYGRCPVDNTWFDPKKHIFEDNAARREILSLSVKCDNHTAGCEWKSELRSREKHLSDCPYGEVPCSNDCGKQCPRRDLEEHLKECPNRLEKCQHCKSEVLASEMTKHQLFICEKFPVNCSTCGETSILRENIPRHMDSRDGDCPLVVIKCQFENLGCFFQDKRKNMLSHYKSANLHHMTLITMKIQQQDLLIRNQQQELADATGKCQELAEITDDLQKTVREQGEVIQVQASCISELESLYEFDGRLLWRVRVPSDVNQPLVSPFFYTGRPGYKVNLAVNPATPAADEGGPAVSAYLNVEPGQFDSRLLAPFQGSCNITIFDQSGAQNNFKYSFAYEGATNTVDSSEATGSGDNTVNLMKRDQLLAWPYMKDESLLILIHVDQTTTPQC